MTGVTRVWSQTGKEVLGAKLWVMTLSAGLKGWEGKRGVSGGIFDKGGVKTGRLARRPGGLPRASHSNCRRPQFHQEESGSLALPPHPALSCRVSGGRPLTSAPSASLHSFLVKNKAYAYQLAGDNVRMNDKICKARSACFGRGEKCQGCVTFPKSGFLCVIFFFPVREAVLILVAERSQS